MTDNNLRDEFEAWVKGNRPFLWMAYYFFKAGKAKSTIDNIYQVWAAAKESSKKDIEELKAQRDFYEERWKEVSEKTTD